MRRGSFLRNDLSAEYVREHLNYDPETGIFTWRVRRRGRYPDRPVGCKRKGDDYLVIQLDGHLYIASRLAWLHMTGEWPAGQIDHKDLDRSNNRWSNLRDATASQNKANAGPLRNNKLGVRGVCEVRGGRFKAQLKVLGKAVLQREFHTLEEARAAYVAAYQHHFGEFARSSYATPDNDGDSS